MLRKDQSFRQGEQEQGWVPRIPAGFPEVLLAPGGRQAWPHCYPTALLPGRMTLSAECHAAVSAEGQPGLQAAGERMMVNMVTTTAPSCTSGSPRRGLLGGGHCHHRDTSHNQ